MTVTDILTGNVQFVAADGTYEQKIKNAANLLDLAGASEAVYLTQWTSGTTAWQFYSFDVTVTADGTITGLPPLSEPTVACSYDYEGADRLVKFVLPANDDILTGLVYKAVCHWGFLSVLQALKAACKVRREANAFDNLPHYARSYRAAETAISDLYNDLAQRNYE